MNKNTINDGGPAFPIEAAYCDGLPAQQGWNGMTLRDYFAAAALQGEITYGGIEGIKVEHISLCCYEMADAMLKAREVQP